MRPASPLKRSAFDELFAQGDSQPRRWEARHCPSTPVRTGRPPDPGRHEHDPPSIHACRGLPSKSSGCSNTDFQPCGHRANSFPSVRKTCKSLPALRSQGNHAGPHLLAKGTPSLHSQGNRLHFGLACGAEASSPAFIGQPSFRAVDSRRWSFRAFTGQPLGKIKPAILFPFQPCIHRATAQQSRTLAHLSLPALRSQGNSF